METANIINLIFVVMTDEKERRKERRSAIGSIMTLVYSSVCAAVHRCKTIGPTSTVIPYNAVTIGFLSTSMTSCFKRLKLNQSGTAPSEIFRRHIHIFLRELIFPDFGGGQKSKPLAIRIWLATAIRLFFIFRTFHKHMFV